jgi:hypothetical protein
MLHLRQLCRLDQKRVQLTKWGGNV